MNRLNIEKQELILKCLVDGNSIRATCRITGAAKNTVIKLLTDTGIACSEYQDKVLRDLPCTRIEVDEIWAFIIYARKKNVPEAKKAPREAGDVWAWVALSADTKLVPSWVLGDRSDKAASVFMNDLKQRLTNRVQLTSDGLLSYPEAIRKAFGKDIDYAQLIKHFGSELDIRKQVVNGEPLEDLISTSYIERCNLTMRMGMRRYTRKTNGFSKKLFNHAYSVALHFMYYNFCRPHLSLDGKTPAMAACICDHKWNIRELIELVQEQRDSI